MFPGAANVLIEKGKEALEDKRFTDAALHLSDALNYPLEDEDEVKMALILALYESEQYEKGLDLCQEMLREGIGDYEDVLDVYLLILIQKKQFEEVHATITALLEEKQLPESKREHFEQLLKLSAKMKEPAQHNVKPLFMGEENLQEKTLRIIELVHANIQPYKAELIEMLGSPHTHPFLQTLVLNVLKEHGVNEPVEIKKFYYHKQVIPSALVDVFEMSYFNKVLNVLEENLSHKDPILFEQAKEIVKRHFFLLYPFEPVEIEADIWAEASLHLIRHYYQEAEVLSEDGLDSEMTRSLAFIKELDEISSPIL